MRVTALAIHPFKACRPVSVTSARLTARGLAGDRRWMVVDSTGRFISQREVSTMALIRCELIGDELVLRAPAVDPIAVPRELDEGTRMSVEVWSAQCDAIVHEDASAWFTRALGQECRAVYMPDTSERPVRGGNDGEVVSFADGYPYLLATEASLTDLNRRLATPIVMQRFRPNIVVDGDVAFAEDAWQEVRIGSARFRVAKGCDRCVVTTVDPETGNTGVEPLRTLATFRRRDGKVWFGINLVAEDPAAEIRVGDTVVADPPAP